MFLVEHVELLGSAVNNTIHHPSATGVEHPALHTSFNGSSSMYCQVKAKKLKLLKLIILSLQNNVVL